MDLSTYTQLLGTLGRRPLNQHYWSIAKTCHIHKNKERFSTHIQLQQNFGYSQWDFPHHLLHNTNMMVDKTEAETPPNGSWDQTFPCHNHFHLLLIHSSCHYNWYSNHIRYSTGNHCLQLYILLLLYIYTSLQLDWCISQFPEYICILTLMYYTHLQ